jgi:peptide/nickel transport system permease protein
LRPSGAEVPVEGDLMAAEAQQPGRARRSRPRRRWPGVLGGYVLTLLALVTLNFFIPRAMPGDPVDELLGQSSSSFTFGEQSRTALREYYGLDGSLLTQYRHYLGRLAHGDLGRSIATLEPVRHDLRRKLPWTLLLVGSSLLLATALGLLGGVHAGWRRDRPLDRALLSGLLALREFPAFLLGSLLLFVFAVKLGWLPIAGAEDRFGLFSPVGKVVDIARHLLLPLLVLTLGLMVGTYLVMRAGMVSELGADHLLLGRAKGLAERRLKYRYAARNALLPVVSLMALQLGFVVTGDVLVEQVFEYPGLGRLLFDSIAARDYPVIQGTFLLVSITVVTANALADAAYRRLDPRTAG